MARVRLSGGRFRGQWIEVPGNVRPTAGRVREALLSIWQQEMPGARFLDLFAGSGATGLEALGRGAALAVLVESDPRVARALRGTLTLVAPGEAWRVVRLELPQGLVTLAAREDAPFDLVFADPPYRFDAYPELVGRVAPLLAPGGRLAVEHSARMSWPDPESCALRRLERRDYGETSLTFYG